MAAAGIVMKRSQTKFIDQWRRTGALNSQVEEAFAATLTPGDTFLIGGQIVRYEGLRELTELARVPVYALGGMTAGDLEAAWEHGAQGIAAMRRSFPPRAISLTGSYPNLASAV